ncbi:MAG TPA: ABC transporter permease [Solirubrobacteraceae bacterium]|nr:ABC transporter permease [Solirubrobacteraceae bacterium]
MRRATRIVLPLIALAVLIGAWEVYVDAGGADPTVLPPPHAIFSSLWNDRSLLWRYFHPTAEAILLGILVAALIGLSLAIVMHLVPVLRAALYPVVVASQTIPIPLIAPLLVFWLGFGLRPELFVIALISFFSIVVTTLNALASVDPALLKLIRTFDGSRLRAFRHVELPAALPGVFTGAKIAAVVSAIGALLAEQANGSTSSLGFLFVETTNQSLFARAWAEILLLSLFTIALFAILSVAERLALPWAYQPRGEITA